MKSSHKLAAALATFVLLSVASYFIITQLQGASKPTPSSQPETLLSSKTLESESAQNAPVLPSAAQASETTQQEEPITKQAAPPEVAQASREPDYGHSTIEVPISISSSSSTTTSTTTISTTTTTAPTTVPSAFSSTPDSDSGTRFSTTTTTTPEPPPLQTSPELKEATTNPIESEDFITTDKLYREATRMPSQLVDLTPEEVGQWEEFKMRFGRAYIANGEEDQRRQIFINNLRFINVFNQRARASFKLGVNRFADLTPAETNSMFIGPAMNWTRTVSTSPPPMRILPDPQDAAQAREQLRSVDWRSNTGPPVNQGICRDSSVFALVAALESALNAAAGTNRTKLSEQQIIDCLAMGMPPPPQMPPVCSGLLPMSLIAEFVQRQGIRLATLDDYDQFKQAQVRGQAPPNVCVPPVSAETRPRMSAYVQVNRDNLEEALVNSSPLVVSLDASQPTFHFYQSGVYHETQCSMETHNFHALLVASSSETDSQLATFTIRASLGAEWGEAGHMRLLKDQQKNKCLPQNTAIYPNLAFE